MIFNVNTPRIRLLQTAPDHPALEPFPARRESHLFLVELARVLHHSGVSADGLENTISDLARRLGESVQVFCTPTSVQLAFDTPQGQQVFLLRTDPAPVHLGKLTQLRAVLDDVLQERISLTDAQVRLCELECSPQRYSGLATIGAFALLSGTSCCFFGGTRLDTAASVLIGALIGALSRLAVGQIALGRAFEPLAAALATFCAHLFIPMGASSEVVTLSALVVLLPGFTLTTGLSELANRHLVSGTARLSAAGISFLSIAFGVALGRTFAQHLSLVPTELGQSLPPFSQWVALALAPIGFAILFQAQIRHSGWILAAGVLGFLGARLGTTMLGAELGVCVGSLVVGLGGNLLARRTHLPASLMQVPGVMMLVPGSIGFRSLASFLDKNVLFGIDSAFRMVLVAVALVAGLLFANLLVSPRRAL